MRKEFLFRHEFIDDNCGQWEIYYNKCKRYYLVLLINEFPLKKKFSTEKIYLVTLEFLSLFLRSR